MGKNVRKAPLLIALAVSVLAYEIVAAGIAFTPPAPVRGSAIMLPQAGTVSLPQAAGAPATSVTIPITVTSLTGLGVQAYDFTLVFNQSVLQLGNPSFDSAGTLSSSMTITPNTATPGQLVISAFGTTALSGAGTLINLKFNVVGAAGTMTPLTFQSFVFNEGSPSATIVNGSFTVTGGPACPAISSISPTSGAAGTNVVIAGNNFSGVTAVKFFNNVTASFTVNSNTQITATVPAGGTTGPITISKPGCPDVQTATFTVTGGCVPVAISTNLTGGSGSTLIVPVTVGSVTGLGVTAYDFVLTFNSSVLSPANPAFDTAGTLSSGMTITPNTGVSGQITISAFGTTPLIGSGTLLNLRFTLMGGAGTCSNLTWTSFNLNEGNPCATTSNGQACVANDFNVGTVSRFSDFDMDGKADIGFYRAGLWGFLKSAQSYSLGSAQFFSWGGTGLRPICSDYDGDGKADIAFIAPPSGGQSAAYSILQSSRGYSFAAGDVLFFPAGFPVLGDTPVVGDFDGDGKTDPAIWRASQGVWIIPKSSTNYTSFIFSQWGQQGDTPIIADFDMDGKADIGFYRNGLWGVLKSGQNYSLGSAQFFSWGGAGLQPVTGDFDGDGKADIGHIVPPSGGQSAAYAILKSSTGYSFLPGDVLFVPAGFPVLGDTPVVGEFDGDGKDDPGIWRESQGVWIVPLSASSYATFIFSQWGQSGDIPFPNTTGKH